MDDKLKGEKKLKKCLCRASVFLNIDFKSLCWCFNDVTSAKSPSTGLKSDDYKDHNVWCTRFSYSSNHSLIPFLSLLTYVSVSLICNSRAVLHCQKCQLLIVWTTVAMWHSPPQSQSSDKWKQPSFPRCESFLVSLWSSQVHGCKHFTCLSHIIIECWVIEFTSFYLFWARSSP